MGTRRRLEIALLDRTNKRFIVFADVTPTMLRDIVAWLERAGARMIHAQGPRGASAATSRAKSSVGG